MKKLHFGCGKNILKGWENLDLPQIDVTKTLPYKQDSISYIFHEHLLEHLDESDGFNFLKECYRILEPKGIMRISIPYLDGILFCYNNWSLLNEAFSRKYKNNCDFFNRTILGEAANFSAKFLDTNMKPTQIANSNKWHKFYYSEYDMRQKLQAIGFNNYIKYKKHESEDTHLQLLERRVDGIFSTFPKELDLTFEVQK